MHGKTHFHGPLHHVDFNAVPRRNNAKVPKEDFVRSLWSTLKTEALMDSLSLPSLSKAQDSRSAGETIYNWAKQHPEFALEIDLGKG